MGKIKNDLPISKKIVFLMAILFLILCMPINGIEVLADEGEGTKPIDSPPIDNNSPSVTLRSCLEWYEASHPTPIKIYDGECKEIVGYGGYLSWIALEDMKGRLTEGCEPAKICEMSGTIGEKTDDVIELESFEFLSPDAVSDLEAYDFSVYGFVRCTEPVLRIIPEKEGMLVKETIPIKVYLDCGDWKMDHGEPVILKVVSGPGELDLPELSPDDIKMLRDKGYFFQGDIIITKQTESFMVAEAMLNATNVGTIEIVATYESCQSTITKIATVYVGQWVRIDCTYKTDPDYLGTDDFQWGGDIHCEVCLETYQDVQFGINVQALRGYASGTQECWVVAPDDYWIENKNCPAFTGEVIDGAVWDNRYDFVLDIDDSAALTYDRLSGEKDRPQRTSRHEWDPVVFMETPIHLDADEDATYTYEGTNMLGTRFTVVARWK
ncbi:MAG: hypothetical protein PHW73_09495 [Atribacterota bacterium]|nr:hypothetical protein [Atribacterota bacterium]